MLAVLLLAAGGAGCDRPGAQADPVAPYRDLVRSLLDESLARGRAHALLGELCRVAPSRLAGSPGYLRAAEWARETLLREGCDDVRLEPVPVTPWERGDLEVLEVLEPREARGARIRIAALGGSVATPPGGVAAEVIAVRSFDELRQRSGEARGKIVLFDRPMDPTEIRTFTAYGRAVDQRTQGAVEAARAGGVAALVRSVTTRHDDVPHTGMMRYANDVERVPAAAVSLVGADRIAGWLASGERVVVRLELGCRLLPAALAYNVIGELRGRERPEEIVLVGGHLDAWDLGQGAHDDGAGCCQAIEVVRLLRAVGFRPRRTVRVVLFANEEMGLGGARAYHEAHRGEMDRHVLAVESDRGGFTPRGFTTDANPRALEILRAIASLLEETGISRVVQGGGGADVSALRESGVVVMDLVPDCQRYFDYHHSANDVFEAVHEREIALGAAALASLIGVVSDLPERLPPNR